MKKKQHIKDRKKEAVLRGRSTFMESSTEVLSLPTHRGTLGICVMLMKQIKLEIKSRLGKSREILDFRSF